ncbi:hypothetical protein K402DRAFT_422649 [Aulographum hederae CBS 113979]|uniref:Uncharacterized protein n=1 Tax=Aulographum hederae CBS 113979 TaxID=1176131 RepID=A0A6G1GVA2_9PEZI|nr:hypothetical protein K402DRAFT_422649 [Aulographum hederae CBS 113979]
MSKNCSAHKEEWAKKKALEAELNRSTVSAHYKTPADSSSSSSSQSSQNSWTTIGTEETNKRDRPEPHSMTDTNILQYNYGNSNGDKAKPVFDSIDPSRFPILAIQEPMITERNLGYTYTPSNYRTSRPITLGMRVVFMIHDKIPLTAWKHITSTDHTELLQVSFNGADLQVINIYSPPGPSMPSFSYDHIVLYCPELREQRAYLLAEIGSTDIRRVVNNKKTAGKAAQWLLRTNALAQFKVALEIEEEEMEGWKPFQPLEEVC